MAYTAFYATHSHHVPIGHTVPNTPGSYGCLTDYTWVKLLKLLGYDIVLEQIDEVTRRCVLEDADIAKNLRVRYNISRALEVQSVENIIEHMIKGGTSEG